MKTMADWRAGEITELKEMCSLVQISNYKMEGWRSSHKTTEYLDTVA